MKKGPSLKRLYERLSAGDRSSWLQKSKKGHAYFLGDQISPEDKQVLLSRQMPDFIINKMQPQIELAVHFSTAGNPAFKSVGVDGSDADVGNLAADVIQHIMKISSAKSLNHSVVRDAMTKAWGYYFVTHDPNADQGLGEIYIKSLDPWEVFPDPASRDPLLRDASYVLIAKNLTLAQVERMFPRHKTIARKVATTRQPIIGMGGGEYDDPNDPFQPSFGATPLNVDFTQEMSADADGNDSKYVQVFEMYERVSIPMVTIVMMTENAQGQPEMVTTSMSQAEYDAARELDPELEASVGDVMEWTDERVVRHMAFGDETIARDIPVPGRNLPVIGVPWLHTGTVFTQSLAWSLVGKQDEINKMHQLTVHHATLSSNSKWLVEEKMITNEEEFSQNASKAGGIIKYRRNEVTGDRPMEIGPQQLNSAYYTLQQSAGDDMEYLSGMGRGMMGQGDYSGREAYRGLIARDEFGSRRISSWVRNVLEPALEQLGHVVLDWAQDLFPPQKVLWKVQPGDRDEWMRMGIATGYDERALAAFYDKRKTNYDIMFASGSTIELNRWARFDEYMQLFSAGIISDADVLMITDVPNKLNVLERTGQIQSLAGQVESLSQQLQDLQQQNKRLENALVQERANARSMAMVAAMMKKKDDFARDLEEILARAEGDINDQVHLMEGAGGDPTQAAQQGQQAMAQAQDMGGQAAAQADAVSQEAGMG